MPSSFWATLPTWSPRVSERLLGTCVSIEWSMLWWVPAEGSRRISLSLRIIFTSGILRTMMFSWDSTGSIGLGICWCLMITTAISRTFFFLWFRSSIRKWSKKGTIWLPPNWSGKWAKESTARSRFTTGATRMKYLFFVLGSPMEPLETFSSFRPTNTKSWFWTWPRISSNWTTWSGKQLLLLLWF